MLLSELFRAWYQKRSITRGPFKTSATAKSVLIIQIRNTTLFARTIRQRVPYRTSLTSLVCCLIKSVCAVGRMPTTDSFGAIQVQGARRRRTMGRCREDKPHASAKPGVRRKPFKVWIIAFRVWQPGHITGRGLLVDPLLHVVSSPLLITSSSSCLKHGISTSK
jgi:hypothetical protein